VSPVSRLRLNLSGCVFARMAACETKFCFNVEDTSQVYCQVTGLCVSAGEVALLEVDNVG
jgi:hypothetical protein